MNIWQQLEIEPTSDLKIIKRAYAKKLKVTRPDENPNGFQDLHYAYKTALYHASRMDEDEDEDEEHDEAEQEIGTYTEPEPTTESVSLAANESDELIIQDLVLTQEDNVQTEIAFDLEQDNPEDFLVNQEHSIHSESQPIVETSVNPFQVEGERLLGIIQMLLTSDGAQAKAKSWEFLIESEFILEDHFNWRLGLEILPLIREHNVNNAAKIYKIVGRDALTYLNSIFNWIDNRHHVLQALGEGYSTWLDLIVSSGLSEQDWQDKIRGGKKLVLSKAETKTQLIEVDQIQRMYAWLIDIGILFFFAVLLFDGQYIKTSQPITENVIGYFALAITIMYFCIFETSRLQASIGKRIMKLRVVDTNGNAIGFLQGIKRTILYCLFYVSPYFIVTLSEFIMQSNEHSPLVLLASWFLIGVFGFSKITLYDRFSRTRVLRLTKIV